MKKYIYGKQVSPTDPPTLISPDRESPDQPSSRRCEVRAAAPGPKGASKGSSHWQTACRQTDQSTDAFCEQWRQRYCGTYFTRLEGPENVARVPAARAYA